MAKTGALKAYIKGLKQTVESWKLSLYLWGVNLIFALLIFFPFYNLISKELDFSLSGDRMASGFDLFWFTDFIYKYESVFSPLFLSILFPVVLYVLFNTFITGGIIGRLYKQSEKITIKQFVADCGKYWGRFFRLFLISVPVYLIVLGVAAAVYGAVTSGAVEGAVTELTEIVVNVGRVILLGTLFFILSLIFDYAKIGMAGNDSTRAFRWMIQSTVFVFKNLISVAGLFILNGIGYIAATFLYLEIATVMPENSLIFVMLVFFIQQLFMLSKAGMKVLVYSSGVILFMKRSRSVI